MKIKHISNEQKESFLKDWDIAKKAISILISSIHSGNKQMNVVSAMSAGNELVEHLKSEGFSAPVKSIKKMLPNMIDVSSFDKNDRSKLKALLKSLSLKKSKKK